MSAAPVCPGFGQFPVTGAYTAAAPHTLTSRVRPAQSRRIMSHETPVFASYAFLVAFISGKPTDRC